MKILLIEDRAEEQSRALETVSAAGHELHGAQEKIFRFLRKLASDSQPDCRQMFNGYVREWIEEAIQEVDGIVTDLMFRSAPYWSEAMPPTGLLVVISAITAGKPVVVCTNAQDEGGHHSQALSWIFDGYVSTFKNFWEGGAPFGWVEDKDWSKAVRLLETMKKGKV